MAIIQSRAAMMLGTGDKERASILSTARERNSCSWIARLWRPAWPPRRWCWLTSGASRQRFYLCLPASRMGTHSRWLRLIVNLAVASLEREQTVPALPVIFSVR